MTVLVLPIVGSLALMRVLGYGLYYYDQSANDSSPPFLSLGVPDWIAILGVGGGIILMLVQRRRAPAFFTEPRQKARDPSIRESLASGNGAIAS